MVLSLGSAKPMLAAIKRCGSLVEFSLITVNATCPGLMCFRPSLREINLQLGGKIEETRTMLHAAMPALRNASSKLESRSRCLPTPLVKKIFLATNAIVPVRGLRISEVVKRKISLWKSNKKDIECQCQRMPEHNINVRRAMRNSLGENVLNQFSKRSAERLKFPQVFGSKFGPSFGKLLRFAADLNNSDHFSIRGNRRAEDSLNDGSCQFIGLDAFEDAGVASGRKIIVQFGAVVADVASG